MNSDMNTNDGGPIHPIKLEDGAGGYQQLTGLSIRDWFAGQALQAIIHAPNCGPFASVANESYQYADAMMAEREKAAEKKQAQDDARGEGGPA